MVIKVCGTLMEIEVTPYTFEGKQGIARKLVIYNKGSVCKIKVDELGVEKYRNLVGKTVEIKADLFIKGYYNHKAIEEK